MMPIENQNIRIVILRKKSEAIVLLKQELFLSDIVDDVMAALINVNFNGRVIFDMLLVKGLSDRYYNMQFRNKMFDFASNKLLENPKREILSESKKFYRTHPDIIFRTSLTRRQKDYVRAWMEKQ